MVPPQDIWRLLHPSSYLGSGRSTRPTWGRAGPLVLPRVGPVHVPVVGGRADQEPVLAWPEDEPGDYPLPALVVAVQQVDGQRLTILDGLASTLVVLAAGVAERTLPEAGVAGRNVQVAGLVGEVFRARAVFPAQVPRVKSPPVQHGQPAAGVAQRCRQQNRPVLLLRERPSATEQHVIAALEIDLLRAIVQLRWNEQRAEPRHQGTLGNA